MDESRIEKTRIMEELGELRLFIESLPHLVLTWRADGSCVFLNRQWVEYTGIPAGTQLGYGWLEQLHPEDRDRIIREWNETAQAGVPFDIEFRIRRHDGIYHWFKTRAIPIKDSQGVAIKWYGSNTDIEDLKRAEEASLEASKRIQVFLDSTQDQVFIVDPEGRIEYLNPATARLLGVGTDDAVGKPIRELFPPGTREIQMELINQAFALGRAVNRTVEIGFPGGEVWLDVTLVPQQDATGKVRTAMGIARDVTKRKRSEDQLRISEAIYRTVIENIPQKVFVKGRDFKWLSINNLFARDLGLKPEDIVGKVDYDLFPKDLADKYRADDQRTMETGATDAYDEEYIEQGQRKIVHTIKAPVRDEDGTIRGLLGVFWDITEEKRSQDELRRNARELSLRNAIADIFLTMPDDEMYTKVLEVLLGAFESKHGVFGFIDSQGGLVVPTMSRTVWDRCQVLDKQFVFPQETWGNSSWPTAIREQRMIYSNEPSTCTPVGHVPITRHACLPIQHRGEVIGLIQVANKETDYTKEELDLLMTIGNAIGPVLAARQKREREEAARRRAEELLRKSNEALKRSNHELEQFAYVASHDLQEPLRMVSSFTQLLAKRYQDQLDQDAKEFISFAVDGANRMQRLIQDLLSYSRVTTRGQPMVRLDTHDALGEVVSNLQVAIQESGALVTNGELPEVLGDRTQIVQVFQNLIGNGIKFRRLDQHPRIHVQAVRFEEDPAFWRFSISDNGIGIDERHFERLFVIFQRLHSKQEYPGMGIGLALCKRIVERHGGRIWLESVFGQGTTFHFTLPGSAQIEGVSQ